MYRAFISKMIINKLANRDKIFINTPEEVIKKLIKDNYEEVILQPTLIINGIEYEKVAKICDKYRDKFSSLVLGTALLTTRADYEEVVKELIAQLPEIKEDEAVVFMGHGTYHHTTSAYPTLEYIFHLEGYKQIFVGTAEGFPNFEDVVKRLQELDIRKIYLIPFMFVAGEHAINDMAGEDEDTWESRLKEMGYKVEVLLKGIGEFSAIREMFIRHAKEAEASELYSGAAKH